MPIETLTGPWGGMDWRETASAENSSRLSLNVDTHRGYIEARRAMAVLTESDVPFRARLHLFERIGVPGRYVLAIGVDDVPGPGKLCCAIYDADNFDVVGPQQDLTALGAGVETGDLRVSFIDTFLPVITEGVLRPATLVVLREQTFVFEPLADDTALRAVDLATDSSPVDPEVYAFLDAAPHGGIATQHQQHTFYAGWHREVPLTVAVGYGQTDIPASAIVSGGAYLAPDASWVMWSDALSPLAIWGASFLTVPPGERVVAMQSLGEALLVLTDRSAYLVTGDKPDNYSLSKVGSGCGCASSASLVVSDTVAFWMGDEGVFAFGGLAAPEVRRITDGIEPLWSGNYGPTNIPDGLRPRLSGYGWPWRIEKRDLQLCVGRVYHARDQVWWSLPVQGGPWAPRSLPVTLVLDLPTMGWHLYFQTPNPANRTYGYYLSCFTDALEYDGRWISSGANVLQESRAGVLCDGVLGSTPGPTTDATGVPMIWGSQRILGGSADVAQVQGLWFKALGTGVPSSLGGTIIGSAGVAYDLPAWFIDGEEGVFDTETSTGTEVTDYDQRRARYGALQLHAQPSAAYFLGTFVLGTNKPCGVDFFTSRADVIVTSRGFVVGVVDDPWTNCARGNMTQIASIGLELKPTGRPNQ